jgi:hypothetical protein
VPKTAPEKGALSTVLGTASVPSEVPSCQDAQQKGHREVAKNTRQTGAKAASAASKVLSNPKSTKTEKSAAASALSQTPKRK